MSGAHAAPSSRPSPLAIAEDEFVGSDDEREASLNFQLRRMRIVLATGLILLVGFLVIDLFLQPRFLLLHLTFGVALIGSWYVFEKKHKRVWINGASLFLLTVSCVVSAVGGIWTQDPTGTLVIALVFANAAPIFVGWSPRVQLVASSIAGLSIVINMWIVFGGFEGIDTYVGIIVFLALALPVISAWQASEQRRQLWRSHEALERRVRERTAALEQANRVKTDFLSALSHELRTPLHIIIGYNRLLIDGEFGTPQPEQLLTAQRIEFQAVALLEMINATLGVARIETGQLPVSFQTADLNVLLAELRTEVEDRGTRSAVELRWQVPEQLPLVVTDPPKLKLVLRNLVHNAFKFTQRGYVEVSFAAANGSYEFSVKDTGIGIPREAFELIFEPFRQVDASVSNQYGGVGLGLYIVRRIVTLLGGSIQVDSEVGSGSTFRVRLPREQGATGSGKTAAA